VESGSVTYTIVRVDGNSTTTLNTVTLDAGDTDTWTGYVPNGETWTIEVRADGETLATGTFEADCDPGLPAVVEPAASLAGECEILEDEPTGAYRVRVELDNTASEDGTDGSTGDVTYVIRVGEQDLPEPFVVTAGTSTPVDLLIPAGETRTVSVLVGDEVLASDTFEADCLPDDPDPEPVSFVASGSAVCTDVDAFVRIDVVDLENAEEGTLVLTDGAGGEVTSPIGAGTTLVPWPVGDGETLWVEVGATVRFGDVEQTVTVNVGDLSEDCTEVLPQPPVDPPVPPQPPTQPPTEEPGSTPPSRPGDDDEDEVLGVVHDLPRTGTSLLVLMAAGLAALGLGTWLTRRRDADA